jgi:hypothetical protein
MEEADEYLALHGRGADLPAGGDAFGAGTTLDYAAAVWYRDAQFLGSSKFMRRTVGLAWHLTTVLMWGMAVLLLNMSLGTSSFISAREIMGCIFVACAVLSFVVTRGKHFSWIVFGIIALLTLISR